MRVKGNKKLNVFEFNCLNRMKDTTWRDSESKISENQKIGRREKFWKYGKNEEKKTAWRNVIKKKIVDDEDWKFWWVDDIRNLLSKR